MEYLLSDNCSVFFANRSRAKQLMAEEDDYTSVLTKFDLQAKIQTVSDEVTVNDYLINAQRYLYDWRQSEIDYLVNIVNITRERISELGLSFDLPERIYIVKSAMFEEGGARGFTRKDCIVLNKSFFSEHLFEHELFHIISRYNSRLMKNAYSILGFQKCNEVVMPHELEDLKISNPDAPFNNYLISVRLDGKPVEAIMLIYSGKEYSGGGFFGYLKKSLLIVEGEPERKKAFRDEAGSIVLKKYEDVDGLYEQIGRNTGYNIHPEELTADHFSFVLHQSEGLPDQNLVDDLTMVLQNG